jgi:hypothetical protein
MKKIFLSSIVFFLPALSSFAQTKDTLYKLYKDKQFIQLEKTNTAKHHSLYSFYKAVYTNVCNQPDQSNLYLDSFMQGKKEPPLLVGLDYWKLRNDNYVKLFDYKNAYTTQQVLMTKYKSKYSAGEYKAELYTSEIWRVLINEKRQTTIRSGSTTLPTTHDLAGLINIHVQSSDIDTSFVFDTGAGMSSITESLAKKMKFRILPGNEINVAGFSNIFNVVQIAVADELRIGDIVIHNEPFLVFKDEALTFAGGAYKINGIIGFPVAKELGSITITPGALQINDLLLEDATTEKNLFIELLHPVLFLKYKKKLLPFNFDTGAGSSQLSKKFFTAYRNEVTKSGQYKTNQNASAGGTRKYKAFMADNVHFMLNEQEIIFPVIEIDIEHNHVSSEGLYGNIGQDLLKKYQKVTINFKNNYLKLEN